MVLEEWDKEWTEHGLWTSGHHIAERMAKLIKQSQADTAALRAQRDEAKAALAASRKEVETRQKVIRDHNDLIANLHQDVELAKVQRDKAEAALTELRAQQGKEYWRGFQQATYNKPGSLTTADELIAVTKELAEARARLALPPPQQEERWKECAQCQTTYPAESKGLSPCCEASMIAVVDDGVALPPQAQEPEKCADSAEAEALKWRRLFRASTLETR